MYDLTMNDHMVLEVESMAIDMGLLMAFHKGLVGIIWNAHIDKPLHQKLRLGKVHMDLDGIAAIH